MGEIENDASLLTFIQCKRCLLPVVVSCSAFSRAVSISSRYRATSPTLPSFIFMYRQSLRYLKINVGASGQQRFVFNKNAVSSIACGSHPLLKRLRKKMLCCVLDRRHRPIISL